MTQDLPCSLFTVSTRLSHLSRQTNRSEDHLKPKSSTAMSTDSLGEKFRVVTDPRDVSNIGKAPGNSSIYLQESVGVAPDFGGEVVEVSGVVHGCRRQEVISKQGLDSNLIILSETHPRARNTGGERLSAVVRGSILAP